MTHRTIPSLLGLSLWRGSLNSTASGTLQTVSPSGFTSGLCLQQWRMGINGDESCKSFRNGDRERGVGYQEIARIAMIAKERRKEDPGVESCKSFGIIIEVYGGRGLGRGTDRADV